MTTGQSNASIDTPVGIHPETDTTTLTAGVRTGLILDIEANGQIVGGACGVSGDFTLTGYNGDGSVDTTFGSNGVASGVAETAGLAMTITSSGETVIVGTPPSGTGIILQEFHTQSGPQRMYAETDADDNVTSLTSSAGTMVERYAYDPYGNVTVENADGSVRGDGTAASSFYGWVYLHQGLRLDVGTDTYDNRNRVYLVAFGRFLQGDPAAYVDGSNLYQFVRSRPVGSVDESGLDDSTTRPAQGGPINTIHTDQKDDIINVKNGPDDHTGGQVVQVGLIGRDANGVTMPVPNVSIIIYNDKDEKPEHVVFDNFVTAKDNEGPDENHPNVAPHCEFFTIGTKGKINPGTYYVVVVTKDRTVQAHFKLIVK